MRRMVDLICVLVIAAIAVAAVMMSKRGDKFAERVEETRAALVTIQGELVIRSQSGQASLNPRGWSETIVPAWFGGELPANTVLSPDRPWMEIASVEHASWEHPRPMFDVSGNDAAFWYNPALGIVRARVPMQPTDRATIDSYNAINNVSLHSLSPSNSQHATLQPVANSSE
jgi:hypothetical protein